MAESLGGAWEDGLVPLAWLVGGEGYSVSINQDRHEIAFSQLVQSIQGPHYDAF